MANRALFPVITVAMLAFAIEAPAQQQQQQSKPKPPEKAVPAKSGEAKGDQAKAAAFMKEFAAHLCQDATKCLVTVKVGPSCSFQVTPFTLGVPRGNRNVKIHWEIDPGSAGNASFARTKGIFFKSSNSEFDDPRRLGDKEFKWNDKNPTGPYPSRPFGYGINVVQDGRPCPTLDPNIVNDY